MDDPWGFPERPPEETNRKIPFGFVMVSIFMNRFNPFTPLRAAGPIGKSMLTCEINFALSPGWFQYYTQWDEANITIIMKNDVIQLVYRVL